MCVCLSLSSCFSGCMPICIYQFFWCFSACVSGSFSGTVFDSISGSLAVQLMVSLPVLLALSLMLCLFASDSFTVFLAGPFVVYQLYISDHVSGWLPLWLCLSVSLASHSLPVYLQLCGTISLGFCLAVLGSVFEQCLCCVSGCTSDSVWQCFSLGLYFCLIGSLPFSSDWGRIIRFGPFSAGKKLFPCPQVLACPGAGWGRQLDPFQELGQQVGW